MGQSDGVLGRSGKLAAKRDYYEVLGVAQTASADEVKSAYRRLARKHHPDVNPGDGEAEGRFKEMRLTLTLDPTGRASRAATPIARAGDVALAPACTPATMARDSAAMEADRSVRMSAPLLR